MKFENPTYNNPASSAGRQEKPAFNLNNLKTRITDFYKHHKTETDFSNQYKEFESHLAQEYPAEAQVIMVLCELQAFTKVQKRLLETVDEDDEEILAERRRMMIDLTQWQSLVTDFLINLEDQNLARSFWREAADIYRLFSEGWTISGIQRGVTGQVGIYKALKYLGLDPRLSIPPEDAFIKADLWVSRPGGETSVQVKHTKDVNSVLVEFTGEVAYPSNLVEHNGEFSHLSSADVDKMVHVAGPCRQKSNEGQPRKVRALKISAPPGSFYAYTGEPHPDFIVALKAELANYFTLPE